MSSHALSEHSALNCPGLATLFPQHLLPRRQIRNDQYILLDLYISTRYIRLLTPSSLNASFIFSCGMTLPDETWEALAHTSEIAFSGTSSILPIVFPGFWESRGKMGYLTKLRAEKITFSVQGIMSLPVGVSSSNFSSPPLLEDCHFHRSPGAFHRSSQLLGVENSEAWHLPSPPPHEHSSPEYSGASPLPTWGLSCL